MTYRDLYEKAEWKLEKGEITGGEFDEMTKPLDEEVRPHGEWIEKEDFNQDIYYDCSICGNSWCTLDGTPWQNGMNFCPHCGADMRPKEGD